MTPVLVTPPDGDVVDLVTLKAWCRVDHDDEDAVIAGLGLAAVAYLDGWRGVLGRAILEQVWSIDYDAPGDYILPMADVVSATVDYGDGAEGLALVAHPRGFEVTLTAPGTLAMTCAMDEASLSVAKVVVSMLVAHWYEHRGAVAGDMAEVPMQAGALIQSLRRRWVQ